MNIQPAGIGIAVQIMNQHEVQSRLFEVKSEGAYIVRANSEDDAGAQRLVLSYYARGTVAHHTIVRQVWWCLVEVVTRSMLCHLHFHGVGT